MATALQPATDSQAVGITIRMYRVGFGDFFLMSVPTADGGKAHILIDCGVHAHDIGAMPAALELMHTDTGGHLALVIMTHRHADHISGFASGQAIFAQFTVEQVWMPWFEGPDERATGIQKALVDTAEKLQRAFAARASLSKDEVQCQQMASNILGITAGGNDLALEVLHSFKRLDGTATPVAYYAAGDMAALPPVLSGAGLTADILGPPTDLALVAQMDNAAHQYLTSDPAVASVAKASGPRPFDPVFVQPDFEWPTGDGKPLPLYSVKDIREHVADNQPTMLAAAAQSVDNAINNQSLVVLFTFKGKTMLFCGDAQWGNWANFLFGGPIGAAGHTELTERSTKILGTLDFLKVGHHGSTNATPVDVVNVLRSGCAAMCSTDPGAYGKPDKGTEVPRIPLLAALDAKTGGRLARSDQVTAGNAKTVDPALKPLPGAFQAGAAGQFIDYTL